MLKSFMFDGKLIPLIKESRSERNVKFFAADSMTLLVGKNGSGKTRAMHKIASFFSNSKLPEVENEDFKWENSSDPSSTYAIYYTPT